MIAAVSALQALLVYSIVKYQPSEYGSYRFPAWAELLGILMGLLSCLMIPAGMLLAVLREEGSLWEVSLFFLPAFSPPALWLSPFKKKKISYPEPGRILKSAEAHVV